MERRFAEEGLKTEAIPRPLPYSQRFSLAEGYGGA